MAGSVCYSGHIAINVIEEGGYGGENRRGLIRKGGLGNQGVVRCYDRQEGHRHRHKGHTSFGWMSHKAADDVFPHESECLSSWYTGKNRQRI